MRSEISTKDGKDDLNSFNNQNNVYSFTKEYAFICLAGKFKKIYQ